MEIVTDFLALILPHEPVIDEDRPDIRAGLVKEDGEHGAVHAAGDAADDLFVADFLADAVDDLALEIIDPERQQVAGVEQEIMEDAQPLVAVGDFRVELDAEEFVVPLQRDRRSVLVFGDDLRTFRQDFDGVRVAHPDLRGC